MRTLKTSRPPPQFEVHSNITIAEPLRDRIEQFIEGGTRLDELYALLQESIDAGTLDALSGVQRLFEDMYGGITFHMELKAPAASVLVVWGEVGLRNLVEGARRNSTHKNLSIAIELLASVAAGHPPPVLGTLHDTDLAEAVDQSILTTPGLQSVARALLADFILSITDEAEAIGHVASAMWAGSWTGNRLPVQCELFAAISTRLLAVSTPVLDAFDALIRTQPENEPAFQEFLTKHPQILDPLAIRVWPQPDLFGFRSPDYILQRADGTYLVIEIECPGKRLVTNGGQLTSEVTHAEQQVADYRRYLVQRFSEIEKHLPNFQEPDCLVVVGLVRTLNPSQKQALHDANNGRTHTRIVGFDWLLDRARTIAANIVQPEVEVREIRVY